MGSELAYAMTRTGFFENNFVKLHLIGSRQSWYDCYCENKL